ncbi:hypothetical protein WK72_05495 [Burkholderia ubonensis]|nr:hypothetical protein WK72_05495 [Burkholderia ubonensis]KWN78362.1 hypothetical protein WM24_29745 [Burkholderia ubonensis]
MTPSGPTPAPELHVCDPEYVAAFASGTPAMSNRLTSSLTEAERLLLPRADANSDAATQVPRDSFQIERYARFMSGYLKKITLHTGFFCKTNTPCARESLKLMRGVYVSDVFEIDKQ